MLTHKTILIVIVVVFLIASGVNCAENEENVCKEERRVKYNVTQYFIQNVTVRDYKWCMNVPPRCSFYRIRPLLVPHVVEEERLEVVETCCPGFTKKENRCLPNSGKCDGVNCSVIPPHNNNNNRIECLHGTYVATNDSCLCFSGWKGYGCESLCDEGYYGEGCLHKCNCPFCNSTNGECDTERSHDYPDVTTVAGTLMVEITNEKVLEETTHPQQNEFLTTEKINISDDEIKETTTKNTNGFLIEENHPSTTQRITPSTIRGDDQIASSTTTKHMSLQTQITPESPNRQIVCTISAMAIGCGLIVSIWFVLRRFHKKRNSGSTIGVKSAKERACLNDVTYADNLSHGTRSNLFNEGHLEKCCECNTIKNNHGFYFYDYPPSTGSYRAASSISEPAPAVQINSSLRIDSDTTLTVDHVYDEIPAQKAHRCVDVYLNTSANAVYFNETAGNCPHCFT